MPEFISFLHCRHSLHKGHQHVSSFDIDCIVRNELERDAINLLPSIQPLFGDHHLG